MAKNWVLTVIFWPSLTGERPGKNRVLRLVKVQQILLKDLQIHCLLNNVLYGIWKPKASSNTVDVCSQHLEFTQEHKD